MIMLGKILLIGISAVLLSGCSAATYSNKLQDYQGTDRVGITFDNRNLDYIRVYPTTDRCIDVGAHENGYTNNAFGFQTKLNNKALGFPAIPETPTMIREFWVSAQHNIAVRMIAANGGFTTVTFKPVVGNYYYVTGKYVDAYSPRRVEVYEVFKTEKGDYDRRLVNDLMLKNCGQYALKSPNF
ncbi:hypothetical protein CTN06_17045 [Pectobacterium zantedeschiae]|uniref:Lipoprotein n=2 Tax=Pectobacterium zantedeschiae TaxID=2034769 RepID=A0A9X8P3K2_9GAMM|nr:hypothetical protein CTN06_17045 [Pectobacterium zantedeschiae]RYC39452.1 hypothetical protein CLR69_20400 [Pectobacterium zantedeschiae]